jgi:membrane-bound lytic murein transglycosylase B
MNVPKTVRLAIATCVLVAASSSLASAEIVYMVSGRTLSVKAHKKLGDTVVLSLRGGGDVTLDQSLIEKIVPDEVPHPEPAPAQAEVQEAPKPAPVERGAGLRSSVYSELIATAAQAHGVDPILVQAVIQVESNYQPRARSHKGAMGLMQLMPATAREYRVRNAYDPKANINAGIQKLKGLIEKAGGNIALALAAYNAGEGAVARYGGIPPYRETQTYVSKILSLAGIR